MFYELMSYDVIPGRAAEFLELCRSRGLPIRGEKYGRLEGFWRVDIGRQYQVMHLWSHASVEARQAARLKMAEDQAWQTDFLPYCLPLMVEGETRFMSALAPLTPPPAASGIYEIRFTTTRPLKGRSWFQDQTAARAAHCVGAWQNIAGRPYEIITLLWHASDADRRRARDAEGDRPLEDVVVREETSLLVPTAFSPLG